MKPPRCRKFGCDCDLVWMKQGESRQTNNGFLTAGIDGWHCPVCAAGYGGTKPNRRKKP